jgi:hypothetical protein
VNGDTRDSGETPGTAEIVAGGEFAGHRIVAELGRGAWASSKAVVGHRPAAAELHELGVDP